MLRSRCKFGTPLANKDSKPSLKLITRGLQELRLSTRLLIERPSKIFKTGSRKSLNHSPKAFAKSLLVTSATAAIKIDKLLSRMDKNLPKNTEFNS